MTDRPMIFGSEMVRALVEGRKTQTRRILKPQPPSWCDSDRLPGYSMFTPPGHIEFRGTYVDHDGVNRGPACKFIRLPAQKGDRLWVKEQYQLPAILNATPAGKVSPLSPVHYPATNGGRADDVDGDGKLIRLRHALYMPRWASRITLIVTDVRVQRVQDISNVDAAAEGCAGWLAHDQQDGQVPWEEFRDLWNSIHGPDAWDRNDWVVAYTFDVVRANIDAV